MRRLQPKVAPYPLAPCVLGVILLAAAGGCAAPTAPKLLSPDAVVLPLPVIEQDRLYDCGLVSIASLCRYYRVTVPDDVRDALLVIARDRQGLSGRELSNALRRLGMDVWIFEGSLDRGPTGLLRQVDCGRPALVMTGAADDRHYALFIGYDETLGTVCLLDPLRGQIVLPTGAFDRTWRAAQRFSLLAVPTALTASAASHDGPIPPESPP